MAERIFGSVKVEDNRAQCKEDLLRKPGFSVIFLIKTSSADKHSDGNPTTGSDTKIRTSLNELG